MDSQLVQVLNHAENKSHASKTLQMHCSVMNVAGLYTPNLYEPYKHLVPRILPATALHFQQGVSHFIYVVSNSDLKGKQRVDLSSTVIDKQNEPIS